MPSRCKRRIDSKLLFPASRSHQVGTWNSEMIHPCLDAEMTGLLHLESPTHPETKPQYLPLLAYLLSPRSIQVTSRAITGGEFSRGGLTQALSGSFEEFGAPNMDPKLVSLI